MLNKIVILNIEGNGDFFWREELSVNQALVKVLRFARDRDGICTIELRGSGSASHLPSGPHHGLPTEQTFTN